MPKYKVTYEYRMRSTVTLDAPCEASAIEAGQEEADEMACINLSLYDEPKAEEVSP